MRRCSSGFCFQPFHSSQIDSAGKGFLSTLSSALSSLSKADIIRCFSFSQSENFRWKLTESNYEQFRNANMETIGAYIINVRVCTRRFVFNSLSNRNVSFCGQKMKMTCQRRLRVVETNRKIICRNKLSNRIAFIENINVICKLYINKTKRHAESKWFIFLFFKILCFWWLFFLLCSNI